MFGFLNIAKQRGATSHDVVNQVRRITRIKRTGHGGTLDPAAEGVLIIALGNATRLLRFLDDSKVYLAEIQLGTVTTTDDLEGDIVGGDASKIPDESTIRSELSKFVGDIEQIPPAFSAIHVGGKRLYELARKGEVPDDLSIVPKRTVHVEKVEMRDFRTPIVTARISCGGGTYIRSIARDLGQNLGCGGTLKSLVREKAGPFDLRNAITLDTLKGLSDSEQLSSALIDPINALANLSVVNLEKADVERLTKGQTIVIEQSPNHAGGTIESDMVLTTFSGKAIAVCRHQRVAEDSRKLEPEVVLTNAV